MENSSNEKIFSMEMNKFKFRFFSLFFDEKLNDICTGLSSGERFKLYSFRINFRDYDKATVLAAGSLSAIINHMFSFNERKEKEIISLIASRSTLFEDKIKLEFCSFIDENRTATCKAQYDLSPSEFVRFVRFESMKRMRIEYSESAQNEENFININSSKKSESVVDQRFKLSEVDKEMEDSRKRRKERREIKSIDRYDHSNQSNAEEFKPSKSVRISSDSEYYVNYEETHTNSEESHRVNRIEAESNKDILMHVKDHSIGIIVEELNSIGAGNFKVFYNEKTKSLYTENSHRMKFEVSHFIVSYDIMDIKRKLSLKFNFEIIETILELKRRIDVELFRDALLSRKRVMNSIRIEFWGPINEIFGLYCKARYNVREWDISQIVERLREKEMFSWKSQIKTDSIKENVDNPSSNLSAKINKTESKEKDRIKSIIRELKSEAEVLASIKEKFKNLSLSSNISVEIEEKKENLQHRLDENKNLGADTDLNVGKIELLGNRKFEFRRPMSTKSIKQMRKLDPAYSRQFLESSPEICEFDSEKYLLNKDDTFSEKLILSSKELRKLKSKRYKQITESDMNSNENKSIELTNNKIVLKVKNLESEVETVAEPRYFKRYRYLSRIVENPIIDSQLSLRMKEFIDRQYIQAIKLNDLLISYKNEIGKNVTTLMEFCDYEPEEKSITPVVMTHDDRRIINYKNTRVKYGFSYKRVKFTDYKLGFKELFILLLTLNISFQNYRTLPPEYRESRGTFEEIRKFEIIVQGSDYEIDSLINIVLIYLFKSIPKFANYRVYEVE